MSSGPFWIGYKPSTDFLAKSITDAPIANRVDPSDLHLTLFYCNDIGPDVEWPVVLKSITSVQISGLAILGDSLVLLVEPSRYLFSRFEDLVSKYPTEFKKYIPHITIGYKTTEDEFAAVSDYLNVFINARKSIKITGESIQSPKDPSEKLEDRASLENTTWQLSDVAMAAYFDTAKRKSELDKMLGRSGVMRSMSTYIAKNPGLMKAWDSTDYDVFRKNIISFADFLKANWEKKNELLEAEKKKGKK